MPAEQRPVVRVVGNSTLTARAERVGGAAWPPSIASDASERIPPVAPSAQPSVAMSGVAGTHVYEGIH